MRTYLDNVFLIACCFLVYTTCLASSIDSLKQALIEGNTASDRILTLKILAEKLSENDLDQAVYYAKEGLSQSKIEANVNQELDFILLLGTLLQQKGIRDSTYLVYVNGLELAALRSQEKFIAEFYNAIGVFFGNSGNITSGMKNFKKALETSLLAKDSILTGKVLFNIGTLYRATSNEEKSLEYFRKAYLHFQECKCDSSLQAISQINIASSLINLNKINEAEEILQLAIKEQEKTNNGDSELMVSTYSVLSEMHEKREDFNKAIGYMKIVAKNDSTRNLAANYVRDLEIIGELHFKNKELSISKKVFTLCYKMSRERGMLDTQSDCAKYLFQIFKSENNLELALQYHEDWKHFSDSLNKLNGMERIREIEFIEELTRKEEEKKTEMMQVKLENDKKTFRQMLVISALVFVAITLVLLILMLRLRLKNSKNKRERLGKELEFKKKELTISAMHMVSKNELLNEVANQLKNNLPDLSQTNQKKLYAVLKTIRDGMEQEKSWTEFEVRFKEVHTGFYKKLLKHHPHLTTNELRLCAFSLLNFNTKEIAAITKQSINSIEVARHRLKKKMNLGDTSLTTYLSIKSKTN